MCVRIFALCDSCNICVAATPQSLTIDNPLTLHYTGQICISNLLATHAHLYTYICIIYEHIFKYDCLYASIYVYICKYIAYKCNKSVLMRKNTYICRCIYM